MFICSLLLVYYEEPIVIEPKYTLIYCFLLLHHDGVKVSCHLRHSYAYTSWCGLHRLSPQYLLSLVGATMRLVGFAESVSSDCRP